MSSTAKVDAVASPLPYPESDRTSAVCFKKKTTTTPDVVEKNGVFSGVRSRFHGFVNASMDDHKACISSSYNKAAEKIKCITTRSWFSKGDETAATGGSPVEPK
ncbi:hypothetical protein LINGRAHAP2_LOCUS31416 [Linum grandiflorum]